MISKIAISIRIVRILYLESKFKSEFAVCASSIVMNKEILTVNIIIKKKRYFGVISLVFNKHIKKCNIYNL